MDNRKTQILVLVEGEKTDVKLIQHLLTIYGINQNHEITSYNTNIYKSLSLLKLYFIFITALIILR